MRHFRISLDELCEQLQGMMGTGAEKILRVFDLTDPGKDPEVLSDLPDRIRHAKYHQNDCLLLVSYVDKPDVR